MELKDTMNMMVSSNYIERFKAEYYQLQNRYEKLNRMCEQWDAGELPFIPTCPRHIYYKQLAAMSDYIDVLEMRAKMEHINL